MIFSSLNHFFSPQDHSAYALDRPAYSLDRSACTLKHSAYLLDSFANSLNGSAYALDRFANALDHFAACLNAFACRELPILRRNRQCHYYRVDGLLIKQKPESAGIHFPPEQKGRRRETSSPFVVFVGQFSRQIDRISKTTHLLGISPIYRPNRLN
jgi:hypothetical protein